MDVNNLQHDAVTAKLSRENLATVQSVIDVDKYEKSSKCGYDLCGTYAPFCSVCVKNAPYPCANAYMEYVGSRDGVCAADGESAQSANSEGQSEDLQAEEICVRGEDACVEESAESATAAAADEPLTVGESVAPVDEESVSASEAVQNTPRRIRIAYVRKRNR